MRPSSMALTLGAGLALLTIGRLAGFGPSITTAQIGWSVGVAAGLELLGAFLLFLERYTGEER